MELITILACGAMMLLSYVKVRPSLSIYLLTYLFSVNTTKPINCTTGDIRLVGGTKDYEGRLEVCINNVWGTVCGIWWDILDTIVACKQLGHQELGILQFNVSHIKILT